MVNKDLVHALNILLPDGRWSLHGDVLVVDDGVKKPTQLEIDSAMIIAKHNTPLLEELAKLDAILPRYAEASAETFYDDIKARKQELRSKIK